jgi:spermidine/putrescine transport system ATP-binding protein
MHIDGKFRRCVTIMVCEVDTVLELRALTKHYPTHRAVNGVSLTLKRGEFFALVGPSGCGKTTTLRLIAGLESPTAGDILLNGSLVVNVKPYRRNVSTVFQNYALFPHLSVEDNVAFGLERQRGLTKPVIRQRVEGAIALVQMSGKESRFPHQISGGERQRVALARSLVLEPEVLLLDEPLSALDPKLRKEVRSELKALQRRVGVTFLFVTHDQEEALSLCDRMAVMNEGRLEQIGLPDDIYRQPRSRFTAEFLGEVNWVDGAGIRPECVRLTRKRPDSGSRSLPAVVISRTYLGSAIQIETQTSAGERCLVRCQREQETFEPGESVNLYWHAHDELPISIVEAASAPA